MIRPRALAVLAAFAASLALGIVLLIAFDPSVQTVSAEELVERRDDARAFLAADYFFVLLYAVVSPVAIWRFGGALPGGRPRWIAAAALLLVAAGLVDAIENTLLLSATDSVSEGAVDTAHALEIPKIGLFVAGLMLAIAANVRAVQTLRGRNHSLA